MGSRDPAPTATPTLKVMSLTANHTTRVSTWRRGMVLGQGLPSLMDTTRTLQVRCHTAYGFIHKPLISSLCSKAFPSLCVQVPTTAPQLLPLLQKQSSRVANQARGRERVGPEGWESGQMETLPLHLLPLLQNLTWIS